MELWADPHGVGVDEFLDHVGAAPVASHFLVEWGATSHIWTVKQLGNQSLSRVQPEELGWDIHL